MPKNAKHLKVDTHKDRGQWFLRRSTFPLRDAPPTELEKFWDNPDRFAHVHDVQWDEAGPTNFPGRVTTLVVDPTDPKKLFAGTAAGGVWVSGNRGDSWSSCWPRLLNQHIGALAVDPVDGNVLFCATGEGNLSGDSYSGSGVYQTEDGGFVWTPELSGSREGIPRRVSSITFMVAKEKGAFGIVFGAVSNHETMPAALYIDQGNEGVLPCVFWGIRNYNCHSVVAHPTTPGLLYAAIEPRGTLNGIWRSEDFGATWVHLKRGLPRWELCRRISLAISPTDPNTLYALVGSQNGSALGVYRTRNGGESWANVSGRHFHKEKQLNYNNAIAVHPTDPDFVLCGALDLHLTKNGGKSWTKVSTGKRGSAGQRLPRNYVHQDHHALMITREGLLYSGNDGGVARSDNEGRTWQSRCEGMVTAMFYALDVAETDSTIFGGGTQDNGTLIAGVPVEPGAPLPSKGHFTRVLPGDGGWIAFDPEDAEHVFGSTSDLIFNRHKRGEPWARGEQLAGWKAVSIKRDQFVGAENQLRAIAVLTIPPRALRDQNGKARKMVMAGTNRLWHTTNDGIDWRPSSPSFDGSAISAISCSSRNPNVIFVGTSAGAIFRTLDGGKTWSADLSGPAIPRRVITDLQFHPMHSRTIVAAVAATGTRGASLQRYDATSVSYGHVFQSQDGGDTWQDLDNGSLPDVVFNALAYESRPPYRLFAGGDAGVWMYAQHKFKHGSQIQWASIAGSMPNVVVSDLHFHHKDGILTAATYGRGIWRLCVHEPFPVIHTADKAIHDEPAAAGLLCDRTKPAPELLSPKNGAVFSNYPRTTEFSWKPVEGAIGYTVRIDYDRNNYDSFSSRTNTGCREIKGANAVTWRVWAIFPGGWRSPGSASRKLTYTV